MESKSRVEDLAMTLVEEALRRPEDEREAYLRSACGSDLKLFDEAWGHVQWEKRMQGFLLDPFQPPAADRHPFQPGQTLIKRFRLIREVAQGGMGIVWEAMDERLDRRVALKCAKAGFGKQLPPEVRNARQVGHPNVCRTFEIHTASTPDGELDFISMEFVEGETLAARMRAGLIPEAKARLIAQQICAGLAEAHRNHLIHGDLKPNNVILSAHSDGTLRAVITDFGLARSAEALHAVLGGTPAYMAPELWKGEKPSVASDIYALGVVLWELHSGRAPAELGVTSSTLLLGEHTSWKPPQSHGRWERIIARCLDPDPARRFQNATEVARAFGPSPVLRWALTAAATVALAAGSGWIAHVQATAPAETVGLAMLAFDSPAEDASVSENLLHNTASQLAALKSTAQTRFRFISPDNVIRNRVHTLDEARVLLGASHALRATVKHDGENIAVHAYLTDLRSNVDAKDWKVEYKPQELRYAPTALAALVTGTLHLPPPVGGALVNAAAKKDYDAGLVALRRDSTVDEALRRFERAVAKDLDSALTWAGLAEAQWFEYAAANERIALSHMAESLRQAQIRNSDLAPVHRVSGLLEFHGGHYNDAISEYQRAIQLDPLNGDGYRRLGRAYEDNGQFNQALEAFYKAVQSDPRQYRNETELGDFFYQHAEYDEAAKHLRKAVDLAPDVPRAHAGLGQAYLELGDITSAEYELQTSIRLGETPTALHTMAVTLMCEGKDSDAIRYLLRALDRDPKRSLSWATLGTAYRRVGRTQASRDAYHRGLDVVESELAKNPRNSGMRANLAYFSAQLGERQRSESDIAQALQESPNDATTRWMAAITYEALGRREETLALLKTSPPGVVADLARWPDVADLRRDKRFMQMLESHSGK
jgi:eukaryotic-like serine/threonine-protein kinase